MMANNLRLTDSGNAQRLIDMFGENLRFCPSVRERGVLGSGWYVWDNRHWSAAKSNTIIRMAQEVAQSYEQDASNILKESKLHNELIRHARKSESLRDIQAMITLAQSHEDVLVSHTDFDRDPNLLCVGNGVIDLNDCSFRAFDRNDYITKIAPVAYRVGARSSLWEKFIAQVLPDPDTRDFVQRAVGYSLTGHMHEEKMFLLYGAGQNGKTTFTSALLNMLGEYAAQAASTAFTATAKMGANNELYVLIGKRFIIASETKESSQLDENLIKQLTGMNRASVNPKYKSQIEFYPTWKIWLETNHEPIITGGDPAIWRRMIKVPFTVTIEHPNPELKLRLLKDHEERSGILNWCLEGVRMWREQRLFIPDQIAQATHCYRMDQDLIGQFIRDECKLDPTLAISKSKLYDAYLKYCRRVNEKPKTKNIFGRRLHERNIQDHRNMNDRYWCGIGINKEVSLNPLDFE